MSDSKAPKMRIEAKAKPAEASDKPPKAQQLLEEQEAEKSAESAATATQGAADYASANTKDSEPTRPASAVADFSKAATSWFSQSFPGHEYAAMGACLGIVIALLIFIIGIVRALLIVLLATVGMALGQYLDGDPKLINMIRRVLGDNKNN